MLVVAESTAVDAFVATVPILIAAIAIFEGRKRIGPIFKEAGSDRPFLLMLPGLAWVSRGLLLWLKRV